MPILLWFRAVSWGLLSLLACAVAACSHGARPTPLAAPAASPPSAAADAVPQVAALPPAESAAGADGGAPTAAAAAASPASVTRLEGPAKTVSAEQATVRFVTERACLVDFAGLHALFQPGDLDALVRGPHGRRAARRARAARSARIALPPGNIDVVAVGRADEAGISPAVARALWAQYRPTFLVPSGGRARLERLGIARSHVIEHAPLVPGRTGLDGYAATLIPAHMAPSRHSLRKVQGAAGYVLTSGQRSLYFAGESAFGSQFDEVRKAFGAPDVSILNVVPGAKGAAAKEAKHTLSLVEAAHAQAILASPVAISLPHKERVSHAPAIAPVAGSEAACFITPTGAEVVHIELGRKGACEPPQAAMNQPVQSVQTSSHMVAPPPAGVLTPVGEVPQSVPAERVSRPASAAVPPPR